MNKIKIFRYDIGALRALSVLSVVLYHFKVPFFTGGFMGVDVFFVISGFLMSKIILEGFTKENFSLKIFYEKRVQRLMPALLVLLLFVILLSNIFFFASDSRLNSKYSFLSLFFISNVYYWLYINYFDLSSQANILLHTWSLSVEWQFYILYPLVLLLLKKTYKSVRRKFLLIYFGILLASFILTLLITKEHNNFSFYMFPTRAWEMMFGGLAFLYSDFLKKSMSDILKKTLVIICFTVLMFCNPLINESFIWPSAYTLIPVITTFFILGLDIKFLLFQNKIIQFIGNISYSLYLWHWPIYIIFKYYGVANELNIIPMCLLSLIFSVLSFYFIEQNKSFSTYKVIIPLFLIISLSSVYLFYYPTNKFSKLVSIYDASTFEIANYNEAHKAEKDKQFNPCGCFITGGDNIKDFNKEKCLKIDKSKKNMLLIGDSHSAQFSQTLREKLKDYNLIEVSAGYTFPFPNPKGLKDSRDLMSFLYSDFIPKNASDIDVVLISVHWMMAKQSVMGYEKEEIKTKLLEMTNYYSKFGIKFLILGQTESYTTTFPRVVAFNKINDNNEFSKYFSNETAFMNIFLKTIIPDKNYVDLYNLKGITKFDSNKNIPYMFDDNHFTKYGTDQIVDYLLKNKYF
ncbi:acyltransferase family protein [Flavobacterium psychrolimnae]|uniref:Acyltransferase n=1 Tax=Flavobacterium psychrolimnae TaxID=249351 RepID=A0A366AXM6_9FLAO|nr:acyltransferase family protein [Flavobacterium psychrolimnae]RBN49496.1 hypothetical protein DR980_12450 [Flavobacterium psychrolimnae]